MFEYLPEVCRELNGNIREMYWILLAPFTLLVIILEFFQMPEQNPNINDILKRVAISVIMLISFEECINTMAIVGDGVSDKIQGLGQLQSLLEHLETHYKEMEISWLKLRESVVFILCIISYVVAYAGIFIANVLIHFTWSVLYVCSPLMILMYVSKRTSFVTANLYRGLINVILWKALWSILGVMLLKFATNPEVGDLESFLTTIMINLCIGLSMLFIPLTTKSLLHDGLSSSASALAIAPAFTLSRVLKNVLRHRGREAISGTLNHAKHGVNHLKSPIKNSFQKTRSQLHDRWFRSKPHHRWLQSKNHRSQNMGDNKDMKESKDMTNREGVRNNVFYPDFKRGKNHDGGTSVNP